MSLEIVDLDKLVCDGASIVVDNEGVAHVGRHSLPAVQLVRYLQDRGFEMIPEDTTESPE